MITLTVRYFADTVSLSSSTFPFLSNVRIIFVLGSIPLFNQLVFPSNLVSDLANTILDNGKCLADFVIFHILFVIKFVGKFKELVNFLFLVIFLLLFGYSPGGLLCLALLFTLARNRHLFVLR